MKHKLTARQTAWCEEYLVDLNGAQAAIRAGYSKHTAKQISSENLTKPYLIEKIEELKAARSKRVELSADETLRHLNRALKYNGQLVDSEKAGAPETIIEPNAYNKNIELAMRHNAMLTDKSIVDSTHSFDVAMDKILDE